MKINNINPGQVPHLLRLTADLFREMHKEIDLDICKGNHMRFVTNLLNDLVDMAYPVKKEGPAIIKGFKTFDEAIGANSSFGDDDKLEHDLKAIIKAMQSCTPKNLYPEAFNEGDKE